MRSIDIRTVVVDAEAAQGGVGGVFIEMRCGELGDLAPGREIFGRDVVPVFATVTRLPDEAIVGAGPERVDVLERRSESIDGSTPFVGSFGDEGSPTLADTAGFSRVRSLLMVCQEVPPSVVLKSTLLA